MLCILTSTLLNVARDVQLETLVVLDIFHVQFGQRQSLHDWQRRVIASYQLDFDFGRLRLPVLSVPRKAFYP